MNIFMRLRLLCLLGLGLLTAGAGRLAAQETPVEVSAQGESEVSYDAAEQDALRSAVREAVGVALESQSKVVDFTLIRDAMITRANGYVRSYKVIEKRRTVNDTYWVKLRAECVRGKMNDDFLAIQSLIELLGRPQFSVKVELKPGSEPGIDSWIEGAFMDELDKTGLAVLDGKTANEARERDVQRALAAGNPKKAEQLKLKMGAPYGVTVMATGGKKEEEVYGTKMNMAAVELRVTVSHRDSAEIMASKNATGRAGSADTNGMQDACRKAVAVAFPEVMDRILAHWTRDLDIGSAITLEVAEANYATVTALVEQLRKAEKVTQAEIVEAPEDGIAVVRVIGRIKAETVAGLIPKLSGGKLEGNLSGPRKVTARPVATATPAAAPRPAPGVAPASDPTPNAAAPAAAPQAKTAGGLVMPAAIVGVMLAAAILGAALMMRKK
ncbi:MAG: hypothetical protein WCH61_06975 [bacterium]